MAFHETPMFEFNRFAPWELFCSAYRSGREAENAKSPIERLHFNRSMLLFAFAAMEALINYTVQRLAAADDEDKASFIRHKKFGDKLVYIEDKIGQQIVRTEFDSLMKEYAFLRNEVVHHKRTDQQPQFHVQHVQPQKFLRLLQLFFVRCFVATHDEFPYWITGWNYTGFNGNFRDLFLSNNDNGFGYSLGRLGFSFRPLCGPGSMGFAAGHMSTLEHFDEVHAFLEAYSADVEPKMPGFPLKPRIIRRWWLASVTEGVQSEVVAAMRATKA
jgi:hypothetical protein